ncbi:hypothetical protein RM531_05880 [Salinisphaera sp. P385]|uniref:VWA domain-containing protein n=1 Tax=Spectribacter acetivorans TaxID=3075603 RepID=A0ABU3B6E4_9GAMM|nr:hypothetical protein [Salinisphaera sp. P385]MDT0617995.1 hypothetical protein [Salinisphaera sp. P385]
MSRRRRRRDGEAFGLSFLDAISCGFGAIVLLLVITKTAEPTIQKERGQGLEALAAELSERLPALAAQASSLESELAEAQSSLASAEQRVAALAPQAAQAEQQRAEQALDSRASAAIEQRLAEARQSLTEEMQRLYAQGLRSTDNAVAGIPVDSEYIIFIIDTSGSMQSFAWPAVLAKLRETLAVYPRVKGLQVMNDMGDYMFSQYAGQWIPDTPGRRKVIVDTLAGWQPFSNSSPVEGITRAIRAFSASDKRISIYVFGDEFSGNSMQSVLDTVARLNPRDAQGRPRVRIHAVGFPTQFDRQGRAGSTGIRFATLMRRLTEENGGTFVGLRDTR